MIDWTKIKTLVEIVQAEATRSRAERYIYMRNGFEFGRSYTTKDIPPNAETVIRFQPDPIGEAIAEAEPEPVDDLEGETAV